MSRPYVIRRAVTADARSLAVLGARTFEETFGPANRREDIDTYLSQTYGERQQKNEIENPRVITLVAEEEGSLIAFAQMRADEKGIEIARFYVDRRWQGRGIAQALMQAVIEEARTRRAEMLWLGVWERNERAIAFYRKCGFRDTGSQPFILGSDLQTDRVMIHEL
jgi:ribosomal protein S18 acetylase RimI-like enzyme